MKDDEMKAAVELARRCEDLTDPDDPWPAEMVGRLSRALLAAHAECERLNACHALTCVVALMEPDETAGSVKVFKFSMPSLAHLFTKSDGDALYLIEAAKRAIDAARTAASGEG